MKKSKLREIYWKEKDYDNPFWPKMISRRFQLLEEMIRIQQEKGFIRLTDVTDRLKIMTRQRAHEILKQFHAYGLVEFDGYGVWFITPKGQAVFGKLKELKEIMLEETAEAKDERLVSDWSE